MVRLKLIEPEGGGITAGLKLATDPGGAPETASSIGLVSAAPVSVIANPKLAALPAGTVTDAGAEAASVKSAAAGLPMVTISGGDVDGSSAALPD
jgi:hypothetical protein